MARLAFKKGDQEGLTHVGLFAHHLIEFAKDYDQGDEAVAYCAQRKDWRHSFLLHRSSLTRP